MIDTHLHWFDPAGHPFAADAPYHPQPHECAKLPALLDLLRAHGMQRAVLVAPTFGYNHDRAPLVDALQSAGAQLAGVARLTGSEPAVELDALAACGVVGVRLDLRHDGIGTIARLRAGSATREWAKRQWFVQVQADAADWASIAEALAVWPVDLVIDHCGLPDPAVGLDQPGFEAVCRLATRPGSSRTWIKLSGAFRWSRQPWPHADTDAYAQRLVECFGPERCVWGSDWPFVGMRVRLDYGSVLDALAHWVPDAGARDTVLGPTARALLAGRENR